MSTSTNWDELPLDERVRILARYLDNRDPSDLTGPEIVATVMIE